MIPIYKKYVTYSKFYLGTSNITYSDTDDAGTTSLHEYYTTKTSDNDGNILNFQPVVNAISKFNMNKINQVNLKFKSKAQIVRPRIQLNIRNSL